MQGTRRSCARDPGAALVSNGGRAGAAAALIVVVATLTAAPASGQVPIRPDPLPRPAQPQPQPQPPAPAPAPTAPEPAPAPPPEPAPAEAGLPPAPTAASVAGAPRPGQESGRTDEDEGHDSVARWTARVLLFLPRGLTAALLSPFRLFAFVYDKYELPVLFYKVFFNRSRTVGLYPIFTYATGWGVQVGGRFVARDLFDAGERFSLQATTAGSYHNSVAASLRTGRLLGTHVELGVDASFQRLPSQPFYGIGNGDGIDIPFPPIDPLVEPVAIESRYRYQEKVLFGIVAVRVFDGLGAVATGGLTQVRTGPSTSEPSINQVFIPASLVSFDDAIDQGYAELDLRWDTRRPSSRWELPEVPSRGWLVNGYLGRVFQFDDAPDFWHYGVELQQYLRIAPGPRGFVVRFHGEGVTGDLADIPFTELPTLGGSTFLRGYPYQRFRDRVAAVATAQYQWDLSRFTLAYLFADAGRVYRSLDDLTLDDLRVGYGLGLSLHSKGGFIAEGSVASSIDGGVVVTLTFTPVMNARSRWP